MLIKDLSFDQAQDMESLGIPSSRLFGFAKKKPPKNQTYSLLKAFFIEGLKIKNH